MGRDSDLLRAGTVRGSNPGGGGGEIFRTCPDRHWDPPSLLYNGYRVFPGGKERPGRGADPSPPCSAVVMKGYSYTTTPPVGRTACTEPQCLYKGALYVRLYRSIWVQILSLFGPSVAIHSTDENCALLGYYAADSDNFLPTFRDNLSVLSSGSKKPKKASSPNTEFI